MSAITKSAKGEDCQCYACLKHKYDEHGFPLVGTRFICCEICGNKRCPHGTNHELDCTNSNQPGQDGSRYQ